MTAGGAQGLVCLVIIDRTQVWIVETTRFCGPNMVSCEVVTGGKWTPLIITYLPISTLEHLADLEEALT